MSTYRKAGPPADDLLSEVMAAHHQPLADAGVRVDVVFAYAPTDENTGAPKGPAIKRGGVAVSADVKVTPQRDRVRGLGDACLMLDGVAWEKWNDARRRAEIDDQLTRLELQCEDDDNGTPKLDDCFRPKLRIRPWDAQACAFWDVVERYGEDAPAVEAVRVMVKELDYRLAQESKEAV